MGKAIPAVINVIIMCIVILAMFAILGVNMYAGKMNNCYNSSSLQVCDFDTRSPANIRTVTGCGAINLLILFSDSRGEG